MAAVVAIGEGKGARRMPSGRRFLAVSALLFAAGAAVTILRGASMTALPLCGGMTVSMAWMRMPGETWLAAAASFLAMWLPMMAAMMLPSLAPTLWRGGAAADRPTALVGAGYLVVWTLLGVAVFPAGAALAAAGMRWPALASAAPVAVALTVLVGGALQLTAWKARHLADCRSGDAVPAEAGAAWRHGLRLGARCVCSCAGLTAILLALGVMDLGAMAIVTTAITAERLAPEGWRVARAIGTVAVGVGLLLVARAAGLG